MKIKAVINRHGEVFQPGLDYLICNELTMRWAPKLYTRAMTRTKPLPVILEISKRRLPGGHRVSAYRGGTCITWCSGHSNACYTMVPFTLKQALLQSRLKLPNHDITQGWIRITPAGE